MNYCPVMSVPIFQLVVMVGYVIGYAATAKDAKTKLILWSWMSLMTWILVSVLSTLWLKAMELVVTASMAVMELVVITASIIIQELVVFITITKAMELVVTTSWWLWGWWWLQPVLLLLLMISFWLFITVKEELAAVSFLSLDLSLLARISAWCQLAMKFLVVYEWISELANHGDGVPFSELKWTVKWTEWPITTTEPLYIFGTYFMNENQWSDSSVYSNLCYS